MNLKLVSTSCALLVAALCTAACQGTAQPAEPAPARAEPAPAQLADVGDVHMDVSCSPSVAKDFDVALALAAQLLVQARARGLHGDHPRPTRNAPWPTGALR